MTELSHRDSWAGSRAAVLHSPYTVQRHWTKSLQSKSCLSFPAAQLTLAVGLVSPLVPSQAVRLHLVISEWGYNIQNCLAGICSALALFP